MPCYAVGGTRCRDMPVPDPVMPNKEDQPLDDSHSFYIPQRVQGKADERAYPEARISHGGRKDPPDTAANGHKVEALYEYSVQRRWGGAHPSQKSCRTLSGARCSIHLAAPLESHV